jgi:hypothetical protein
LLAVIEAAVAGGSPASAVPVIEKTMTLLQKDESKGNAHSPWFHYRLVKAGIEAGLGEKMLPVTKMISDPALRGRAELLVFLSILAESTEEVADARLQIVGKESSAYGAALLAFSRHNTRYGSVAKVLDSLGTVDEKLRPFVQMGIALGMQAKKK